MNCEHNGAWGFDIQLRCRECGVDCTPAVEAMIDAEDEMIRNWDALTKDCPEMRTHCSTLVIDGRPAGVACSAYEAGEG